MLKTSSARSPFTRRLRSQQGVALVIVLTALALVSFLVLTILTINRSEQRAATNDAELMDVKTLTRLPTDMVTSQLRRATHQLGTTYTWTSQPGMLRVFDNQPPPTPDPTSDQPPPPRNQWFYKLYSSDALYADNNFAPLDEAAKLSQWAEQPARFVDLNEPIAVRPRIRQDGSVNTQEELAYPILDPSALERLGEESLVQGVEIIGQAPAGSQRQPLPMPVQWLYVLTDGTLASPLPGGSNNELRFDSSLFNASDGRPERRIAGRIAFWTDDESCKVNLNTAGEPAPWSPPHTTSESDVWQSQSQPARGEWHRQSGHPAYTATSPIFRSFGANGPAPQLQPTDEPASDQDNQSQGYTDYMEATLDLLPGDIERGTGSNHGTESTGSRTQLAARRDERLLHHVDELLFENAPGSLGLRQANGSQSVGGYSMLETDVRRARFFVTTHSSAPETNPVNQPKISLWPIQKEIQNRTRFDELMRLAATIGGPTTNRRYYGLSRSTAWKSAASPGSAFSISADLAPNTDNDELFAWLQRQTVADGPMGNIPGYGLSFGKKYGRENCDNLLLNFFDLLRWQKNTSQHVAGELAEFDYLAPGWRDATTQLGAGQVTPLLRALGPDTFPSASPKPVNLRSSGRIPTFTEAAIVFMATDALEQSGNITVAGDGYAEKTTHVRAFIILEPFIDSPGGLSYSPDFRVRLLGLNGGTPDLTQTATLNGRSLNFGGGIEPELAVNYRFSPSTTALPVVSAAQPFLGGNRTAFTGMYAPFVTDTGDPRLTLGTVSPDTEFPWFSIDIEIPADYTDTTLNFQTGDLAVVIDVNGQTVQELTLPLSQLSGRIPIPRLHRSHIALAAQDRRDELLLQRFQWADHPVQPDGPPRMDLIQRGDVVRSVELSPNGPTRGDARALGQRYQVPRHWFAPSTSPPPDPQVFESHSLREGAYPGLIGQLGYSDGPLPNGLSNPPPARTLPRPGQLLPGPPLPPFDSAPPDMAGALARSNPTTPWSPNGIAALSDPNLRFGDWETGPGDLEDGPYLSRADFSNAVTQERILQRNTEVGGLFRRGGDPLQDREGISVAPYRSNTTAIQFGALSPWTWGDPVNAATNSAADPEPWRTLLFCPNPASRTTPPNAEPTAYDHPGFASPPDHLWLEYFWTPIVEPRLLSTGFSTEGKINMNFQIFPFTWIERSTGLYAAMKGVRIPAIPASARGVYKDPSNNAAEFAYSVDVKETLRAFRTRFAAGDVFRFPSEICNLYLAPERIDGRNNNYSQGMSTAPLDPSNLQLETLNQWWNGDPASPLAVDAMELTGDNLRESPYAQLYPRLCTRSNVFRVHYRVQLLRPRRASEAFRWDETKDRIVAEQRGSTVIERYLDLNDPEIPDLVSDNPNSLALDEFYRYRVVSQEPFTP